MKRILTIASAAILLTCCPFLCGAQESPDKADQTLDSGKRITPSFRVILPAFLGISALTDAPLNQTIGFSYGMEIMGVRLSARSYRTEANIGLRCSGVVLQSMPNVVHLGIPVRVAYKFGKSGKAYIGAAAEMRLGKNESYSRFMGVVEGGVSYGGFGLRASYTVTPIVNSSRAVSLGLIIGL